MRNVAYTAAVAAARFNPILKAMKQRLADKGKPEKVILVALIQKLMTLLNAIVRHRMEWRYAPAG